MADYAITGIQEQGTLDPNLRPIRIRIISYTVGKFGPYQLAVPADEFDPVKVTQLIQQDIQKHRDLGLL